jgi:cytochrome b6-f complex iron-sulfur subunit
MSSEKVSRRSFLNKIWLGLGALATAEAAVLVTKWFKPRKSRSSTARQGEIIVAGSVDSFEPGTVTPFVRGRFYLSRLENGGFLALSRTCTHLGCTVPWVSDENRFVCPCHSSAFDINGNVIDPPAPRAMDLFEVSIVNNMVSVDTGKRTKRSAFEASQASYPKRT